MRRAWTIVSALALAFACSSGNQSGSTGGGGTGPVPVQDPTTGKWMCGSHVCQCNDGLDNDGDQVVDTLDPNCFGNPGLDDEAGSTATGTCGTTQCTDCKDNDGDGLIDSADPECTGGLDNDEGTFATGIPGDNIDVCKQDCFFDGNSGQGDDGCNWELKCDPANPGENLGCPYDASYNNCQPQSSKCIDFCKKYTPNGCDCFGCCTVFVDGAAHDVELLSGCSSQDINDPVKCPPCTKEDSCNNPCDPCEYCLGREPDASCTSTPDAGAGGSPPSVQCDPGLMPCEPGTASCPAGYYCLTGCCAPVLH